MDSSSSDSNIDGRHESPDNRDVRPDFTVEEVSNAEVEMEVLQHAQVIEEKDKIIDERDKTVAKLKQDLEMAVRLNEQYARINDLPGNTTLSKTIWT